MTTVRPHVGLRTPRCIYWVNSENKRSGFLAMVARSGLLRCGYRVDCVPVSEFQVPIGDVAVFYGLKGKLLDIYNQYRKAARCTVFLDLGYWHRKGSTSLSQRFGGYHKVVVNGLQPTFNPAKSYPSDRFDKMGIKIENRTGPGEHFLVAGMSAKAAGVYGLKYEEWETQAVTKLKQAAHPSPLPIIYRPKPGHSEGANRSLGDVFSGEGDALLPLLRKTTVVVSHHSNVSVDALVLGVPSIVETGITLSVSGSLDDPYKVKPLDNGLRMKLLYRTAYAQWSPDEMKSGEAWQQLRAMGELP